MEKKNLKSVIVLSLALFLVTSFGVVQYMKNISSIERENSLAASLQYYKGIVSESKTIQTSDVAKTLTTSNEMESNPTLNTNTPNTLNTDTPNTTKKNYLSFTPFGLGTIGNKVTELQQALNFSGYTIAKLGAGSPGRESDFYGTRTENAVRSFQKQNNLAQTGVMDALTVEALQKQVAPIIEAHIAVIFQVYTNRSAPTPATPPTQVISTPPVSGKCASDEIQVHSDEQVTICVKKEGNNKIRVCFIKKSDTLNIKLCYSVIIKCDSAGNCKIEIGGNLFLPDFRCTITPLPGGAYDLKCQKKKSWCFGDDCWENVFQKTYQYKACPDNPKLMCICFSDPLFSDPLFPDSLSCVPISPNDPFLPMFPGFPGLPSPPKP